ncbi:hypothetical protein mRhiFer1_008833 [Rhinolophus ferrumequinum]|uniref:Uncharacterized protein n=1 Tax=Rhinolophus ferrumequinum TaxID=59479 RepID=A0A7J8AG03_RHIFE|nr:hypothetical protein mRhiFer1_008833 [Rhinolophus ferrumequinum]
MPISGLEDLLPPTASSGRGGAKAAGGWEPRLASLPHPAPSLQLRFSPRCTQPRCRKEPHEGRPGGGLMAPTADLPLAPPWRGCGCPRVLPTGKPGLTPGLELCWPQGEVDDTGLGPSPESPWWAVGVLDRV